MKVLGIIFGIIAFLIGTGFAFYSYIKMKHFYKQVLDNQDLILDKLNDLLKINYFKK